MKTAECRFIRWIIQQGLGSTFNLDQSISQQSSACLISLRKELSLKRQIDKSLVIAQVQRSLSYHASGLSKQLASLRTNPVTARQAIFVTEGELKDIRMARRELANVCNPVACNHEDRKVIQDRLVAVIDKWRTRASLSVEPDTNIDALLLELSDALLNKGQDETRTNNPQPLARS